MSEVQRILEQLHRAQEGGAWHGPALREVLNGVTASMAAARPLAGAHSIWELVKHIAVWEDAVCRRIEGEAISISLGEPRDWPPVDDTSDAAWQATLEKLRAGHHRLREAISRLDDSHLSLLAPGKPDTLYEEIHGTVQHILYHSGQIALLKKAL